MKSTINPSKTWGKRFSDFGYRMRGWGSFIDALKGHYQARNTLPVLVEDPNLPKLSLEDYFVNLALIAQVEQEVQERSLIQGPVAANVALERGELYSSLLMKDCRCVETLFNGLERDKPAGWICITGRAGTGKTTLLQYIAYRWSCEEALWHNPFDFVFQVKLNLLGKADFWSTIPGYSDLDHLVLLIHKSLGGSRAFSLDNIRACLTQFSHRILLLLDGFDEIQSLYGANDKIKALIDYAMAPVNFPNGILTSRPNAVPLPWLEKGSAPRFLQYFENVGLTEENVRQYVQRCFKSMPVLSESLLAALSTNLDMMRLAQIPVNIAALCLIWTEEQNKKPLALSTESNPMPAIFTMTILYQRVILFLARRYAINVKGAAPDELDPQKIPESCQTEMALLASLAYQAFENGETQTLSAELLETSQVPLSVLKQIRQQFGILRKAEVSLLNIYAPHYFIHLTYQEYFVALYMAQKLSESPSDNREQEILRRTTIQAMARLIQAKKSEPRYAVIWSFLSGIVSTPEYARGANYFWDAYVDEFEPISAASFPIIGLHPHLKKLESQQRIYREALMTHRASRMLVLPERLATLQSAIQSVMQWQAIRQIKDLNPLWDEDDNDEPPSEAIQTARRLDQQHHQQIQNTRETLDWPHISSLSLQIFFTQNPAWVSALQATRVRLSGNESYVRCDAVRALGVLRVVDEELFTLLQDRLSDGCGSVRIAAAVVALNSCLDFESLNVLYAALKDRSWTVRIAAARALGVLAAYDDEPFTEYDAELRGSSQIFYPLRVAGKVLSIKIIDDKFFGAEWVAALHAALKDSFVYVCIAAAEALLKINSTDAEALTVLRTALRDDNGLVRSAAAEILGNLKGTDVESVTLLRSALKDKHEWVRRVAAQALLKIDSTDAQSLTVLRAALRDNEVYVCRAATQVFKQMEPVHDHTMLLALLEKMTDKVMKAKDCKILYAVNITLLRVPLATYAALPELLTHTTAQRFFVTSVWLYASTVAIDINNRQMIVDDQIFTLLETPKKLLPIIQKPQAYFSPAFIVAIFFFLVSQIFISLQIFSKYLPFLSSSLPQSDESSTTEILTSSGSAILNAVEVPTEIFIRQLQSEQARFIETVVAATPELSPILHTLTQPIVLPQITTVFEPNFLTNNLPAIPEDPESSAMRLFQALSERLTQMQAEINQRLRSGEALTQEQQGELARLGDDLRGARNQIVHLQQQAGSSVSEMDFEPVAEQVNQLQSQLKQLELAQLKSIAVTDTKPVAHLIGRGIFEPAVPITHRQGKDSAAQADEVALNTISFSFKSTGAP